MYSRLSLSSVKNDGYLENIIDGERSNDDDRLNAIAQLRWLPTDTITVDTLYSAGKSQAAARNW